VVAKLVSPLGKAGEQREETPREHNIMIEKKETDGCIYLHRRKMPSHTLRATST